MAEFLISLGKVNLAMGAAILAVYLLRRPVRTAFHAQIAYGLWLLVPVAAFASLLPPRAVMIASIEVAKLPVVAGTMQPILPMSHNVSLDWMLLLFAAWLAGACGTALYLMRLQHKFYVAERAGTAGPAVAGFFRPRIVIPSFFEAHFSHSEREAILAHERAHLSRQDARVNALVALLRCLCWFNPLVHLGSIWLRRDQELACDVMAVREVSRLDYARALLKSQMPAMSLPLGCAWPGSEHPLTERVALLKHLPPKSARRWSGIVLVTLATAIGGIGAWAAQPPTVRVTAAKTDAGLSNSRFSIRVVDESVPANARSGPTGDDRLLISTSGVTNYLWLKREGQINADALDEAKAGVDEKSGKPTVDFRLTPKGRDQFASLTRANVGHRVAIIVNGKAINIAVIMEPIIGGQLQLSGVASTEAEARALAAEAMGTSHPVGVARIEFVGNMAFDADTLKAQIHERERLVPALSTKVNYDPDVLAYDRELLNRYYDQRGYHDFKVTSAVAQLAPGGRYFIVTFTVHEGVRYNFGKITINSKIAELTEKQLLPLLGLHPGAIYNRDPVQKGFDALTAAAGGKGYAFVQVSAHLYPNPKTRTIDVSFNIEQGPRR